MPATWTAVLWLDDVIPVDHEALGIARLLWQYSGDRPRLQGALISFLEQVQSLEDVSFEVLTGRWPLTAVGVQLDVLGRIVGQPRGEQADDLYRLFILAKILVNRSKGKHADLVGILEILGYPTINVDEYSANTRISVAGFGYGLEVWDLIRAAAPGGVLLRWVWSDEDVDDTFQCANTLGGDDTAATSGFGDLGGVAQTTGGYFSGGLI